MTSTKAARLAAFSYGMFAYLTFAAALVYMMGFLANIGVPKSIDSGEPGPFGVSLAVNVGLLALFGIQHTVMARQGFKKQWTKIVPKPIERSTYVLLTNVVLFVLFWQWQPMTGVVWEIESPIGRMTMEALYWAGYGIVALSTLMIHHFDLFGMRQVYMYLQGRRYTYVGFRTPGFYRYMRHPLVLGWMIAFWAAPTMTAGRLVFAAGATAYILIALIYEERDLVRFHGAAYQEYRRRVYAFLPWPKRPTPARDVVTGGATGD